MSWLDVIRENMDLSPKRATGISLVSLSLLFGASAGAQTREELDKARTSFKEGVALMSANNCAAALTKFQAVANVKMTAQVAFNIAECEERLGKLVSSLGNYRLAASLGEGDPKAKAVTSQVGGRVEVLEARIPKLTVTRGKGADTAVIVFDGAELGASRMRSEFPVDPGNHTIVVRIGDKEYRHETVSLAEKEQKTFEVTLDRPPPKLERPDDSAGDKAPAPPADKGASKIPGAVALGVGGVGAALGVVFLVLRGGTLRELDDQCGGDTRCPPSAEPIVSKGKLYTGLAEASFVVAGAGIIAGIVLFATSGPSAPKPAPSATALRAGKEGALRARTPSSLDDRRGVARWIELRPSAPGAFIGGLSLVGRF